LTILGVRSLLEQEHGMDMVAATCDWREVLRTVSTLGPDVVVLDADLDPNGADHGWCGTSSGSPRPGWCSSATGPPAKR
jgi:DNA-binding NarL/FixJ family response regulator